MFLKALATLLLSCAGAWLGSTQGALLGECLGTVLALLLTWPTDTPTTSQPRKAMQACDRLARAAGYPLLVQSANGVVQQNVERWCVAATLGLAGAGQYGLAQLFITGVNLVHATFFQQAGVRALPSLAAGEAPRDTLRQLLRFSATTGAVAFFMMLVALLAIQYGQPWLPQGLSDLKWGMIWLAAGAIAQMLHYSDWLLIGCHRQRLLGQISWMSTAFSGLFFGAGLIFSCEFEYFLFAYFLGKIFLLTTTLRAAWQVAHRSQPLTPAE